MPSTLRGHWALWEAAAPGHPPLPAFSSLLGRSLVPRPPHPQPQGRCGALRAQGTSAAGGGGETGGLTWPADPLHSAGCRHRAWCPRPACAPEPPAFCHGPVGRTEPSWSALQTCVQNKGQVTLGALALATRAREGQGDWNLFGLLGRRCSSRHVVQKFSTSCDICSVVLKIWKSRATNR